MSEKTDILAKLKDNMILFGKVAIPNMFSSESPEFHYDMSKHLLDKSLKQINIIAPRGHAKSSIVGGVFPLLHIMFEKVPKLIV